ncbi:MAG: hypothetical protein IPJ41_13220 [Phycisphaerales bacterium]|nr:hypothetical protein [Phycisphaerales bacterium]
MRNAVWLATGITAGLASCVPAAGQSDRPAASEAAAGSSGDALAGLSFRLRAGGVYTAEADLDGGAGKVSLGRIGTSLAVSGHPDDRSALTLRLGAEFSTYDFKDVATFLPGGGDPVDNAARYGVGLVYSRMLDEHWGLFGGGTIEFAPADDASWGDALLGSGFVGATYQIRDNLSVGLGVGVASRLEDDARFIPIPTIDWQISERWSLHTADRAVDIRGLELSYQATDQIQLFLLGGWASREYRLDHSSAAPDGVFRDERLPIMGGVAWDFLPHATLELGAGPTSGPTIKSSTPRVPRSPMPTRTLR